MSLIYVNNLSFAYPGSYDDVFTDVSFQIDTNWKLGFCGRNGKGKTTFLNLLMGKYDYSGTITSPVNYQYFPYPVNNKQLDTLTILQKIAPDNLLWQFQRELSLLSVDEETLDRPFCSLSNGEQTKVLLAAMFLMENNFLLIDEPTNHLDMEARQIVAKYLNGKAGFILVSHDRCFLDQCTNHTLSINRNNIEITNGSFSVWWQQKQQQDNYKISQNTKLKKEIKRLTSAAVQSGQWADKVESAKMGKNATKLRKKGHINIDTMAYYGEKSRRMQQRRKNLQRRQQTSIDEKSKLLKNIEETEKLKIHPLNYHSNNLLTLEKVSLFYDSTEVLSNLSFHLCQGERLALLGVNGCGKSSILKLINGENIDYTGEIYLGSSLSISYVPQDTSFLTGDLFEFIKNRQLNETLLKTILAKLDFSQTQFTKKITNFSAGQKKKLLLAASLCQQAHLYIWDEPLNYLDIFSRMQIEELLLTYQPTMIFVEHDESFCTKVATKNIILSKK